MRIVWSRKSGHVNNIFSTKSFKVKELEIIQTLTNYTCSEPFISKDFISFRKINRLDMLNVTACIEFLRNYIIGNVPKFLKYKVHTSTKQNLSVVIKTFFK